MLPSGGRHGPCAKWRLRVLKECEKRSIRRFASGLPERVERKSGSFDGMSTPRGR